MKRILLILCLMAMFTGCATTSGNTREIQTIGQKEGIESADLEAIGFLAFAYCLFFVF